jgi:hypothetical protein
MNPERVKLRLYMYMYMCVLLRVCVIVFACVYLYMCVLVCACVRIALQLRSVIRTCMHPFDIPFEGYVYKQKKRWAPTNAHPSGFPPLRVFEAPLLAIPFKGLQCPLRAMPFKGVRPPESLQTLPLQRFSNARKRTPDANINVAAKDPIHRRDREFAPALLNASGKHAYRHSPMLKRKTENLATQG